MNRWLAPLRVEGRLVRLCVFLLSLLTVLASVIPLARFVGVALQRIGYPFDLEWCEGGIIGHIHVVLDGHQLYRKPSFDFTPYFYPPLYYYVSALPSLVLGLGHLAPRLVSFVSILVCFVLLGRWVRDETGDPVAGVAAIGLLSSTYQITGYWFELARVDSFFLVLVLSAHVLARTASTTRRAVIVGVLIAASCFTKQLGFPLAVPALACLTLRSWRLGLVGAFVSGALILITIVLFNVSSHGWFLYYFLELPSRHAIEWERLWTTFQPYFLNSTFPMTLAGVAIVLGIGFGRAWRRSLFHALFVGIAWASSFLPFLKSGGYPNGLIPAYTALALASGLALARLRRVRSESVLGVLAPQLFASCVLLLQLGVLDYDPKLALPSVADLDANQKVVERLKLLPKPLFITGPAYYMIAVDPDTEVTDTMGLIDIFKGGGVQSRELRAALTKDIVSHRYKTIILDRVAGFLPDEIVELIRREYVRRGSVLSGLPPDVIWPKTGAWLRPDTVWEAR
jgi:hypothetical protein